MAKTRFQEKWGAIPETARWDFGKRGQESSLRTPKRSCSRRVSIMTEAACMGMGTLHTYTCMHATNTERERTEIETERQGHRETDRNRDRET